MDQLKERRIDRAIANAERALKLFRINQVRRDLVERPETFTAHIHRLRLPLPPKGL